MRKKKVLLFYCTSRYIFSQSVKSQMCGLVTISRMLVYQLRGTGGPGRLSKSAEG